MGFINNSAFGGPEPDQGMNNGFGGQNQGMGNGFGNFDNNGMMNNGQPMMQQQPMMDQNMMGGQPMMGAQPQMTPQQLMDPSGMNGGYNQFQGVDNNPKKGKFDIKIVLVIAGVALVALALLSTLVFSKTLKCTNETEFGGVKITMTSKAKYWFGNLSYVEAIVEADFSEFEGDDDQREEAMKAYKTGLETGDDVEVKESGMKITVSKKSSEINEDTFEEEPTYEELKEYFEDDDFTCK